jgi:hypothetical protein
MLQDVSIAPLPRAAGFVGSIEAGTNMSCPVVPVGSDIEFPVMYTIAVFDSRSLVADDIAMP